MSIRQFNIILASLLFLSSPSAFAEDNPVSGPYSELAVSREDLDVSPSAAYRNQTYWQLRNEFLEVNGELKRSDNNTWEVKTDDKTYHIQNPEAWINENWFDDGAKVQLYGNLRPDLQRADNQPVLMASHIFYVEASPVKNTRDRIEEEIKEQFTKENIQKYGGKVPFLKRLLDKIGW